MKTLRASFDGKLPEGPIIAHRINGEHDFKAVDSKPGEMRGGRILVSKALSQEKEAFVRGLLTEKASFGGMGARCFIPGLGFTIGSGEDAIEVLVCLMC